MRSLHSNSDYFKFLEGVGVDFRRHPNLASLALMLEFPTLRPEEAKAVFCDWRHSKRHWAVNPPPRQTSRPSCQSLANPATTNPD